MKKHFTTISVLCVGIAIGTIFSTLYNASSNDYGLHRDMLPELVKDSSSPVKYNQNNREYQIVYKTQKGDKVITVSMPLYYSPFTGEKLSPKRGNLFTETSTHDIKEIAQKIKNIKTLGGIEKELGKPDAVFHDTEPGVRMQYTYKKISKSTDLVVMLHDDGNISFAYIGKHQK